MRIRCLSLLVCLFVAGAAFAQNVVIGSLNYQQGGTVPAAGIQFLDTTNPAIADGSITNATFRWLSDHPCTGAFKLRVFRPATDGVTLSLVGETPALDVTAGNNVLQVSFPAMAIKKGDLLAVLQIGPQSCGGTTFSYSPNGGDTVYPLPSNYTGGVLGVSQAYRHMRLDAVASNGAQHFAGVIPVVGAVQGNGAFFRTSLQLANTTGYPIDGKLVWHTAGTSGTSSDPSIAFHLAGSATLAYDDITAALGQSGIGTLDVYTTTFAPDVTARVFNDVGAAGTYGLTEDLVPPSGMFTTDFEIASIPITADLINFRVNIGVRTLDAPTTIAASVYDSTGKLLAQLNSSSKTYGANYFEQVPLAQFLANFTSAAPPAGGTIQIYVNSGGPIVFYTSTVDNRTKDSDLKMVTAK